MIQMLKQEYVKQWAKENNVRIALTEVWEKVEKVRRPS